MEEKNIRPPEQYHFQNPMTLREGAAALVYMPLHVAIIPVLLNLIYVFWPDITISAAQLNLIYYGIGIVFCVIFMRRFLRRAFDVLIDRIGQCLLAFAFAYVLDIALSYIVQLALMLLNTDLSSTPNNEAVEELSLNGYNYMFAMAVFLAPIVEEIIFRGGIFGMLYKRGRVLAYAGSILLFSLYHVWQYAVASMDPGYLLYALAYVPVSFALTYAYERSGSIWTPIFFHMMINAISMNTL